MSNIPTPSTYTVRKHFLMGILVSPYKQVLMFGDKFMVIFLH